MPFRKRLPWFGAACVDANRGYVYIEFILSNRGENVLNLQNFFMYFLVLYPMGMSIVWMVGSLLYYNSKEKHQYLSVDEDKLPGVSVMVACYNEEALITNTIESLANLDYPTFEIIAINDGSKDKTAEILRGLLKRIPQLRLIDCRTNRGKANALKLGLAAAKYEYLMCTDADAAIDPNAIRRIIPHFVLENVGERVGAVTGNPRVKNRCSLLSKIQILEFASIVGLIKRTQRTWGKIMSLSGVFVMYRKRALLDCGLWDTDTVTEDLGVTWKLQSRFWDLRFEPQALCWMIVPETLRGLLKQRARWTQGGVEAILKHKKEIFIRSHLRFVPVMIEQLASGLWAYMLLFSLLIQAITMIIGQHYSFPIGTWGAWLAIMCMVQLFQAARIDSNYEPNMMCYLFYGIWYPLGYWIFNSMMVYVGFPKAFFRRKKKYASWVSPDRGEAPATDLPKPKHGQIIADNPSHTGPESPIWTPWRRVIHVVENVLTLGVWALFLVLTYSAINGIFMYFAKREIMHIDWINRISPPSPENSMAALLFILASIPFVYLVMKLWVVYNQKKFRGKNKRHFPEIVSISETADFYHLNEKIISDMQDSRDVILQDTIV